MQQGLRGIPLSNTELIASLPTRSDAEILVRHYFENISWMFHIIHTPTVIDQMEAIYTTFSHQQRPIFSHLAFVVCHICLQRLFLDTENKVQLNERRSIDIVSKMELSSSKGAFRS